MTLIVKLSSPISVQQITLPKYLTRAINSPTARSGNYAHLSTEEWTKIAQEMYMHSKKVLGCKEGCRFGENLARAGRSGIKTTLDTLLVDAEFACDFDIIDKVKLIYEANSQNVLLVPKEN